MSEENESVGLADANHNFERHYWRGSLIEQDILTETRELNVDMSQTPERRLMYGILKNALKIYRKNFRTNGKEGKKLFLEVDAWLQNETDDWLFSFRNICTVIDVDALNLMRCLRKFAQSAKCKEPRKRGTIHIVPIQPESSN